MTILQVALSMANGHRSSCGFTCRAAKFKLEFVSGSVTNNIDDRRAVLTVQRFEFVKPAGVDDARNDVAHVIGFSADRWARRRTVPAGS